MTEKLFAVSITVNDVQRMCLHVCRWWIGCAKNCD